MKRFIIPLTLVVLLFTGCEKYLDVKPDKRLATPATLEDAIALLDYPFLITFTGMGEGGADNYYLTPADWAAISDVRDRNIYTWQNTAIDGSLGTWSGRYQIIFTANVVLETMGNYKPTPAEKVEYNRAIGGGHFFRAYTMYELLQLYAKPYDKMTSAKDPGIAIRLTPDVNEETVRSSVQDCYNQIIADLTRATKLLPNQTSIATRPNKVAAYGALANAYLTMEDYPKAAVYADSALKIYSDLIDYNTISQTAAIPFSRFNKETVFYATGSGASSLNPARGCKINPELYNSYHLNDLRKTIFFRQNADQTYAFNGSYEGQSNTPVLFVGITTAELLLIRAEALARTGKVQGAITDLNTLLINRWKKGTYVAFSTTDADQALEKILQERRKELVMRNRRWTDLRRLNKDPRFPVTITRQANNQTFELRPNDKRYVFPIPEEVIQRSKIPQNE